MASAARLGHALDQRQRGEPVGLVKLAQQLVGQCGGGQSHAPSRRERTQPQQLADHQIEGHEHRVDDGDSRLVEVVDRLGEKLADLIDEQPEADACHQRGAQPVVRTHPDQQHHHADAHQQAAPEHMGDMQAVATYLRVAGSGKECPGHQHTGDRGEQEDLEPAHGGPIEVPADLTRRRFDRVHTGPRSLWGSVNRFEAPGTTVRRTR